ncbi:MAG: class I SAM-dependent RNA methyltransferase [Oscillospiraceae bacterium]|nr:class I SAM-dependent RNA methyltransferase [Oscillospiraceae bacterium]
MEYTLIAPCYFGTESVLNYEIKKLGAHDIDVSDGRIIFKGDEHIIARANINLRTAERVLILLAEFKATTFDELFDGVSKIDWKRILPLNAEFPVKGSSLSSVLSSVPACQKIIKKSIVEKLRKQYKTTILSEDGDLYKIRFSIRKDVCQIMLDTSGDGLHKRGYRRHSGEAPIKETLAAAIVDLARIRDYDTVQDPFCGSGTLLIEAAQKAMNIAPGMNRKFAAEKYDFIPKEVWAEERAKAKAAVRADNGFAAYGFDIDPLVLETARKNAEKAGVAKYVKFFEADVKKFSPSPDSTVITNPPYGERLGDIEQAARLEEILSKRLKENPVKSAYIITSDGEFESHFGKKRSKRRKLYNGMIPCQLYMYY